MSDDNKAADEAQRIIDETAAKERALEAHRRAEQERQRAFDQRNGKR